MAKRKSKLSPHDRALIGFVLCNVALALIFSISALAQFSALYAKDESSAACVRNWLSMAGGLGTLVIAIVAAKSTYGQHIASRAQAYMSMETLLDRRASVLLRYTYEASDIGAAIETIIEQTKVLSNNFDDRVKTSSAARTITFALNRAQSAYERVMLIQMGQSQERHIRQLMMDASNAWIYLKGDSNGLVGRFLFAMDQIAENPLEGPADISYYEYTIRNLRNEVPEILEVAEVCQRHKDTMWDALMKIGREIQEAEELLTRVMRG